METQHDPHRPSRRVPFRIGAPCPPSPPLAMRGPANDPLPCRPRPKSLGIDVGGAPSSETRALVGNLPACLPPAQGGGCVPLTAGSPAACPLPGARERSREPGPGSRRPASPRHYLYAPSRALSICCDRKKVRFRRSYVVRASIPLKDRRPIPLGDRPSLRSHCPEAHAGSFSHLRSL